MLTPLFSVIIPSNDRLDLVVAQLNRIRIQVNGIVEIICVCQAFRLPEPFTFDGEFHCIFFPAAIGVSRARNEGARAARGNFLIFLDDDDEPADDWLMSFKDLMDARPDADVLFCGACAVNDGSRSVIMPASGTMSPYLAGTWAIRRTLFEQLGGYDESFRFSENTELLLRAQLTGCVTASINQVKLTYHPATSGGSRNLENKVSSCLLMLEKHKLYFQGNPKVKRLFLRMAGVALIQLGRPAEARKLLWQSWVIAPRELKGFLRLVMAVLPVSVSRLVYKKG